MNAQIMQMSTSFAFSQTLMWVSTSAICFLAVKLLVGALLRRVAFVHSDSWRFKNVLISWLHSILATILVAINIKQTPQLFNDMINVSSEFAYITICVSLGYFLYDAIDIIAGNKRLSSQSYEVLLHHALIIVIFAVPLSVNSFVGYTVASLSIEFNTIFLHLRFMLVFCGVNKQSAAFRCVIMLNLATFVLFRILTLCWMTRWIVLNRHLIHLVWFTVGSSGLAVMMIINILLLHRLIRSDLLGDKRETTTPTPNAKTTTAAPHVHAN